MNPGDKLYWTNTEGKIVEKTITKIGRVYIYIKGTEYRVIKKTLKHEYYNFITYFTSREACKARMQSIEKYKELHYLFYDSHPDWTNEQINKMYDAVMAITKGII